MQSLATLGIKVQTEGVAKSAADLQELRQAAEQARVAAQGVGPAVATAGEQAAATTTVIRGSATVYQTQAVNMGAAALGAKQYSQAMRPLPAQISEVAAALSSSSPAFLMAMERSGQLGRSSTGLSMALRTLASAAPGPLKALVAIAVAVGAVGKAFQAGQREGVDFHRVLALTGNAAGVTAGQLSLMAAQLDEIAGSRGQAADILTQLASTGKVVAGNLQGFAQVIGDAQRSLKLPVEETVKLFEELGERPVEASLKLQQRYGYLTAATLAQVKALEEQKDAAGAGSLAQQTFATALAERSKEAEARLDAVTRSARGAKDMLGDLADLLKAPFRRESINEELDRLQAARGNRPLGSGYATSVYQQVDQRRADAREALLRREVQIEEQAAKAKAAAIAKNNQDIARLLDEETRKREQAATAKARFGIDLAAIQRDLDASVAQYSAYESELAAERAAGLVSEDVYYSEKRKLIEQNRDAQLEALAAENARIAAEKASGPQLLENQQRIADNEAAMAILRGEAIAQSKVLGIEQVSSANSARRAFEEARIAAQDYLDTIARQNDRALAGMGLGDRQRGIDAGRNAIEDKYGGQRRDLQNDRSLLDAEGKLSESARKQFDDRLAVIDESMRRELAMYEEHQANLEAVQGDFTVGAREALANYSADAANVAENAREVFENAFQGMEDSLVSFVQTGKLDFKSLADSIIADLLRMQTKAALSTIFESLSASAGGGALSSIAGAIGGLFGGAKAEGGPVSPGKAYLVGERGPEVIIPDRNGTIIPNHQLRGAGAGRNINITVNSTLHPTPGLNVAEFHSALRQQKEQIKAEVFDQLNRQRF